MKMSTKGRYGLRAMVELAMTSEEGPVSIQSIAAKQDLSEKYLEQLLAMLKKAGLVKSVRGQQGGYQINGDPEKISAGDILRALEGDLSPVECSGLEAESPCKAAKSCVTKYVWKRMNDSMEEAVDGITLKELMLQGKQLKEQQ